MTDMGGQNSIVSASESLFGHVLWANILIFVNRFICGHKTSIGRYEPMQPQILLLYPAQTINIIPSAHVITQDHSAVIFITS